MPENIYRQTIEQPSDRIIVALDNMEWGKAERIMSDVGDHTGMGKANSIAQAHGWKHAVGRLSEFGVETFADTKFHDIPETVRLQVKAVTETGPSLITVHASGGLAMMEHAVLGRDQARAEMDLDKSSRIGGILGITILTSLGSEVCISIYGDEPEKKVVQLARLALEAGVDGIVCSAKELRAIRAISALDGLVTVVPGITPEWATKPGDQKRVATPTDALNDGADFLVIGRAITQPPEGINYREAAQRIEQEVSMVAA